MKRVIIAAAAVALLALAVPASPVGAQATTDVYAVHGLNLAGQSEPGGTAVTVCAGDTEIDPNFEFGDVIGPLPLPTGVEVSLQVYLGAGDDCADPVGEVVIDQAVTPTGSAVALVATSNGGEELLPELLPIPLDLSCVDPGNGGAVAVHAANAPRVEVVNTTLDISFELSYGEQAAGQFPVGDYDIEAFVVGGDPEPILAFTLPVTAGNTTIGYAVGGQPADGPTPPVLIAQVIPVGTCEAPPTTAAPTTAAPPAAAPATAQPAFTG